MKSITLATVLFAASVMSASASDSVLKRAYVSATEEDKAGALIFDPGSLGGLYLWQTILDDLFEPLVHFAPDGSFTPGAADSWTYSDDGMSLTFQLDSTAKWSDGHPVTAADFVFAIERLMDPDFATSAPKFITSSIKDAEEVAPYTLRINMKKPFSLMESSTSEIALSPLPRHLSPVDTVPWSTWPGGVTNGAYQLETVEDNVIKLVKNPYAPKEKTPSFHRVETSIMEWPQAASSFLSGSVDYVYGIPERQMTWFAENDIPTFNTSARTYYYALNTKLPELSDRRVRRALRLVVDRPKLVQHLFPGRAEPAYSLIPRNVRGYAPETSLVIKDVEAAFAEAQNLMREAGFGPDNKLKLTISSNDLVQHRNIAEFVRSGWSKIYVDAELDISEKSFRVWFKRFTDGDYVVGRRSWNSSKARMDAFMNVCKGTNDARCGHYDDPEYENVIAAAYAEKNINKRRALFQKADGMISGADVLIPLFHGVTPVALGPRINTSELGEEIRRYRSYELKPRQNKTATLE